MQEVSQRKAQGDDFHRRVLAGDPTATAEIADAYLFPLVEALTKRVPQSYDPHNVPTAVEDAILNYFQKPEQYDPDKGKSLFSYLHMAAYGDLLNLFDKQRRQTSKLAFQDFVEVSEYDSELIVEAVGKDNFEILLAEQWVSIWSQIREVLPDPLDQEILFLMMEGERHTQVFADVLGLLNISSNEQKREVKRTKDRIKKVITRRYKPADFKND
ncbi:MAG: hypothetical protein H6641_12385 [Caldilineaceae bacterium]|nr:hypothetical protein [Caldilineaceae bacterium]